MPVPNIGYCAEFGHSGSNSVGVGSGTKIICKRWALVPYVGEHGCLLETCPPQLGYCTEFGHLGQMMWCI